MAEKVQGKYPDDYRWAGAPSGMAMEQYLRDGEIDARREAFEAADKMVGIIVALRHPGDFERPSDADCDAAIRAYEEAKGRVKPR